jgi:maltose alpha-D-glucosyltransferase/alpha-amylase
MRAQPFGGEQSNTSVMLGSQLIAKSIRHPSRGLNPEFEVAHFLTTRTSFAHTPGLAGWVDYEDADGPVTTVSLLQPFVDNRGDGWQYALDHLRGLVDALAGEPPASGAEAVEARLRELAGDFIEEMRRLGVVTGGLHAALASDPATAAFAPEPISPTDAERWSRAVVDEARDVVGEAQRRAATLSEADRAALASLVERLPILEGGALALSMLADGHTHKIRHHGDYHLGQVLKTPGGFVVIDFEGEPARGLEARRDKHCGLRDVAGMLRSFGYAAHAGLAGRPPADREALAGWLGAWERLVGEAFWRGYQDAVRESPAPVVPASEEDARRACAVFELAKAVYELGYELHHRPDWVSIPMAGISRILRRVIP